MKDIKSKGLGETRVFIDVEETVESFDVEYSHLAEKTVLACLQSENIQVGCEVNIVVTDDASIRQINRQFRNIDRSTDVLSFPILNRVNGSLQVEEGDLDRDEGLLLLGDIILSMETAKSQAEQYGHRIERELAFLISHGVFHLLGYDHMEEDEEAVMIAKQEAVLEKLGLKRA